MRASSVVRGPNLAVVFLPFEGAFAFPGSFCCCDFAFGSTMRIAAPVAVGGKWEARCFSSKSNEVKIISSKPSLVQSGHDRFVGLTNW